MILQAIYYLGNSVYRIGLYWAVRNRDRCLPAVKRFPGVRAISRLISRLNLPPGAPTEWHTAVLAQFESRIALECVRSAALARFESRSALECDW